jgi:uncharacterized membrane protein
MHQRYDKLLAIGLFLAIIFSAFLAINMKPKEHYTEFFILNENGKAGDYPKKLTPGQNATIITGIVNHEQAKARYLLQIDIDQEKILEKNLELNDGEKLMQNVTFNPSKIGQQKLELKLFKDNSSTPYSLHLYLEVNP